MYIYIYHTQKSPKKTSQKYITKKWFWNIMRFFVCQKKVFGVQRSFFSIYEPSKNVWCNRNRENGSCQTPAEGWGAKPPPLMSLGGRLTTSFKKKVWSDLLATNKFKKNTMEVAPSIFVGFFRVIDVMCCFDSLFISPMVFAVLHSTHLNHPKNSLFARYFNSTIGTCHPWTLPKGAREALKLRISQRLFWDISA